jgi:hypothetical protein
LRPNTGSQVALVKKMKKRRSKKPSPLISYMRSGSNKGYPTEVAKVREYIYKLPEAKIGEDLKAIRQAVIFGQRIFVDVPNKDQAQTAMELSKWFFRYAKWIGSREDGKV